MCNCFYLETSNTIREKPEKILVYVFTALILNRIFTFAFVFSFMFVIRKLPNTLHLQTPKGNKMNTDYTKPEYTCSCWNLYVSFGFNLDWFVRICKIIPSVGKTIQQDFDYSLKAWILICFLLLLLLASAFYYVSYNFVQIPFTYLGIAYGKSKAII